MDLNRLAKIQVHIASNRSTSTSADGIAVNIVQGGQTSQSQ
jgi:hypothetical protein